METAIMDPTFGAVLERMGVAGVVVLGAVIMLRYFMAQNDKKDARLSDLTDRFLRSTEQQTLALAQNTEALRELKEAVRGKP